MEMNLLLSDKCQKIESNQDFMMRTILIMIEHLMMTLKFQKILTEETDLKEDELLQKKLMKNDFETLIKENEMNETKGEKEDLIEGESIIRKIHQKDLKVKVEQIHLLFSNDSIIS